MMTWVAAILALLAAVATLIIGLIVWLGDRKNELRIPFLWLAGFVSAWIACNVLFAIGPDGYQFPLALISYLMAMLVAAQTYYFVLRLVKYPLSTPIFMCVVIGYLVAFISVVPGVVGTAVEGTNILTNTTGIILYGVFLSTYLLSACIILFVHLRRASHDLHRQIKIILYGVIVSSVIGVIFNLILPIAGNYQFTQLGPAGAIFFVASVAYAVARYGLFDVRLAIVRTVTYGLSIISLAAIYLIVAYVIFNQILGQTSELSQTIVNVVLTLVLAFLFQPVKRFFDHLTKRLFYKDVYNADDFFEALNKVLTSTTDLRSLLKRVSVMLADTFTSEQAFFFVYTKQGGFISSGTDDHSRLPYNDAEELRALREIITLDSSDVPHKIRRMMVSHKIALVMPLYRDQEIVGYVCLGEHRTSIYSHRDQRVLRTVADELVIAIQNALSVQEVKDLNANLEQRIESATRELRTSNAQLQKLDEAKDEFISMASHQLRTPLTSIKGYVSMLMDGDVGKVTDEQKHLLQEAFISSERMVRLIGDFLNVSRLQTGKFIIDKHPIDLAKIVEQEVDGLEPNASARGLSFTYKKPKNVPLMQLDENKIQQVIMNFADNAIYYSKENSKIKVSLAVVGNYVEFTVKDTGIGVPLAEQEQLFSKFFRATNARKQRPDGTGVGLFLAKKVIDAHNGKIIFESKEGKGSTFGFRLPLPKSDSN